MVFCHCKLTIQADYIHGAGIQEGINEGWYTGLLASALLLVHMAHQLNTYIHTANGIKLGVTCSGSLQHTCDREQTCNIIIWNRIINRIQERGTIKENIKY